MQTLDGVQQPQGLSAQAYAAARLDQRIRSRNNQGFRHALVCALLWGLSYCGLDMLLSRQGPRSQVLYLDPVVIACLIAFLVVLVQAVLSSLWSIRRSSTLEWLCYVIRLDRDNAYLLLCALVSGSVAWLSYLVMQHTGAAFAVGMVMFYPAIGSLIARRQLGQMITRQGKQGLALIAIGCAALYLPEAIQSGTGFIPLFMIGLLVGLGWALESSVATKAMDVGSAHLAVSARFCYEALMWIAVLLLVSLSLPDHWLLARSMTALLADRAISASLLLIAVALTVNYLAWYQSFLLCGVSCGLAVSNISCFISVLAGLLLTVSQPSLAAVIACLLMLGGVALVYSASTQQSGCLREVDHNPPDLRLRRSKPLDRICLKAAVLVMVAEGDKLWDYELTQQLLVARYGLTRLPSMRKQAVFTRKVQSALLEASAAGLVAVAELAIDNGDRSFEGALLCCYRLTAFGSQRLLETRLMVLE